METYCIFSNRSRLQIQATDWTKNVKYKPSSNTSRNLDKKILNRSLKEKKNFQAIIPGGLITELESY